MCVGTQKYTKLDHLEPIRYRRLISIKYLRSLVYRGGLIQRGNTEGLNNSKATSRTIST